MTPQLKHHNDHIGKFLSNGNFYEQKMLNHIKSLGLRGKYVDIGANIGNHSVFFSLYCGPVVAFEPVQENYNLLVENLNNFHDYSFEAHNVALSDREKKVSFEINKGNMGMCHQVEGSSHTTRTLDSYQFDNVALIKIDVEGCELDVLKGAKETIARNKPVIFIETNHNLNDILPSYKHIRTFNHTPTHELRYNG